MRLGITQALFAYILIEASTQDISYGEYILAKRVLHLPNALRLELCTFT